MTDQLFKHINIQLQLIIYDHITSLYTISYLYHIICVLAYLILSVNIIVEKSSRLF